MTELDIPLFEALKKDAFKIHDIMLSVRDVIQCCFLMNNSLYNLQTQGICNSYIISVNTKSKSLVLTAMTVDKSRMDYMEFFNISDEKIDKMRNTINTIASFSNDTYLLFISKGFVVDNFEIQASESDFSVDSRSKIFAVVMNSSDIENMTTSNPILL